MLVTIRLFITFVTVNDAVFANCRMRLYVQMTQPCAADTRPHYQMWPNWRFCKNWATAFWTTTSASPVNGLHIATEVQEQENVKYWCHYDYTIFGRSNGTSFLMLATLRFVNEAALVVTGNGVIPNNLLKVRLLWFTGVNSAATSITWSDSYNRWLICSNANDHLHVHTSANFHWNE
jgi:hypothetical protein